MPGELSAQSTLLLDALAGKLKELWPEPQGKPMDGNGGQYRALQTELESNRAEFHDFRSDVNLRFSEFSTALKSLERAVMGLAPAAAVAAATSDKGSSIGAIIGVAALALTVAGAFGGVIKMNIDADVNYAQERTTTAERHLTDDLMTLTGAVKTLQDTTIPRPELNYRIGNINDIQKTKADKDVIDQVVARLDGQISYIRSDIERMKGDIVTRRENEGHWADLQNRVNLLSDRVNDLAKGTNGATLADQIKSLQDQVSSLVQKFVVVPH